ncbi:hypothetical protein [Marinobacter sp. P4B1]|uniref:hypothetical protein n=1 Tax=Marinobacter sp. P4B1 TaxID=1119533 RepID=UPI00071DFEEE|nr:hypothetical protein [Marinobacter sp. P4B1]KRW83702.1 hypothetical protein AQ621_16770 [Marinobacter sp. P4B1]
MKQNTKITIQYADAANWKQHATVILGGVPTAKDIRAAIANLEDGEFLVAHQVGLPTPQEGSDGEDDHVFCTLDIFEGAHPEDDIECFLTDEPPTMNMSVADLLDKIATQDWDVASEMARLGLS